MIFYIELIVVLVWGILILYPIKEKPEKVDFKSKINEFQNYFEKTDLFLKK